MTYSFLFFGVTRKIYTVIGTVFFKRDIIKYGEHGSLTSVYPALFISGVLCSFLFLFPVHVSRALSLLRHRSGATETVAFPAHFQHGWLPLSITPRSWSKCAVAYPSLHVPPPRLPLWILISSPNTHHQLRLSAPPAHTSAGTGGEEREEREREGPELIFFLRNCLRESFLTAGSLGEGTEKRKEDSLCGRSTGEGHPHGAGKEGANEVWWCIWSGQFQYALWNKGLSCNLNACFVFSVPFSIRKAGE